MRPPCGHVLPSPHLAQGQGHLTTSRLAPAVGYAGLPSSLLGMVYSGSEPAAAVLGGLEVGWLLQESEGATGVYLSAGQAHQKGPQEDR